jgi:cytochrome c-type biogenesis protein CcmH
MSRINQRSLHIMYYVILLLAIIFIPTAIVHAQNPTPSDDEVNAIASQLYCPVCENTPLDVCPTEACRQWRDLIRQMIAEGRTKDEIKQYFVEHYGARVLSEPPRTGLNWLVYIIPPVVILAGAFFLFRALKEWTKPATASAGPGSTPSDIKSTPKDEYIARLEDELKKKK